jgi:hypothetical protein
VHDCSDKWRKRRDIVSCRGKDDIPVDAEVVVDEDVPHSSNRSPRNLQMRILQRVGDPECCFTNYLHMSQDMRLQQWVRIECRTIVWEIPLNLRDGIEDILEVKTI